VRGARGRHCNLLRRLPMDGDSGWHERAGGDGRAGPPLAAPGHALRGARCVQGGNNWRLGAFFCVTESNA
jgi:hypothetical protein